jgi:hypothetical protein
VVNPDAWPTLQLEEQFAPYTCVTCKLQVGDGEDVVYVCRGVLPERRGYSLLYIAHMNCR